MRVARIRPLTAVSGLVLVLALAGDWVSGGHSAADGTPLKAAAAAVAVPVGAVSPSNDIGWG